MDDFLKFRASVQKFVQAFNIGTSKTPCGNDITPGAAHTLMLIAKEKKLSQSRLVGELALDKSNVARLCSSLEKKGFLKRSRSIDDRRSYNLTLTDNGYKLAKKIEKDSNQFLTSIFNAVPKKNHNDIIDILALLTEACLTTRGSK